MHRTHKRLLNWLSARNELLRRQMSDVLQMSARHRARSTATAEPRAWSRENQCTRQPNELRIVTLFILTVKLLTRDSRFRRHSRRPVPLFIAWAQQSMVRRLKGKAKQLSTLYRCSSSQKRNLLNETSFLKKRYLYKIYIIADRTKPNTCPLLRPNSFGFMELQSTENLIPRIFFYWIGGQRRCGSNSLTKLNILALFAGFPATSSLLKTFYRWKSFCGHSILKSTNFVSCLPLESWAVSDPGYCWHTAPAL